MSAPSNPQPSSKSDVDQQRSFTVGYGTHRPREQRVRIAPLELLAQPEPIPDAKNSLTGEQLKELAKKLQPPASWFEKDEEDLF